MVGSHSAKQPHMQQANCLCSFLFLCFPRKRPLQHCFFSNSGCLPAALRSHSSFSRPTICDRLLTLCRSVRSTAVGGILCSLLPALGGRFTSSSRSVSFSAPAASCLRAPPGSAAACHKRQHQLLQPVALLGQAKATKQHIEHLDQPASEQLHPKQHQTWERISPVQGSTQAWQQQQQQHTHEEIEELSRRRQQHQTAERTVQGEGEKRGPKPEVPATREELRQVNLFDQLETLKASDAPNAVNVLNKAVHPAATVSVEVPKAAMKRISARAEAAYMSENRAGAHHVAHADATEADKASLSIALCAAPEVVLQQGIGISSTTPNYCKYVGNHISSRISTVKRSNGATASSKNLILWLHKNRCGECIVMRRQAGAEFDAEGENGLLDEGLTGKVYIADVLSLFEAQQGTPLFPHGNNDMVLGALSSERPSSLRLLQCTERELLLRGKRIPFLIARRGMLVRRMALIECMRRSLMLPLSKQYDAHDCAELFSNINCHSRRENQSRLQHTGNGLWKADEGSLLRAREMAKQLYPHLVYASGGLLTRLSWRCTSEDETVHESIKALRSATVTINHLRLASSAALLLREKNGLLPTPAASVPEFNVTTQSSAMNVPAATGRCDTALFLVYPAVITENWAKGCILTERGDIQLPEFGGREIPGNTLERMFEGIVGQSDAGTMIALRPSSSASTFSHACGDLNKTGESWASRESGWSISSHGREENQKEQQVTRMHKVNSEEQQATEQLEEKQQQAQQQEHAEEQQQGEEPDSHLELMPRRQQKHMCSSEVNHCLCAVPWQEPKRVRFLAYLLKSWLLEPHPQDQGIVFCNCEQEAALLASHPFLNSFSRSLHAGLSQDTRKETLRAFRKGVFAVLVGTDVATRGVDLPRVRVVVHYGLPRTCETYVRRTHRAGKPTHACKERNNRKTNWSCSSPSSGADSVNNGASCDSNKSRALHIGIDKKKILVLPDTQTGSRSSKTNTRRQALVRRQDAGRNWEDKNAMAGCCRGFSLLMVNRGNRQHQAVARRLARALLIHFSEIELPSAEDMEQRYMDEIESQLVSPAALALGKAVQRVTKAQLQLHGPRLLAAALALLLQQHQRMTWQSALSNHASVTPVLFHDPRYQVLRNKEDLLQLLDSVLCPVTPRSDNSSRGSVEHPVSQNSTRREESATRGPTTNKEERVTLSNRITGSLINTRTTTNLSERLLALGVGRVRRSPRGYVVDVSACTARRILRSELTKEYGIKVTYAAALPLLLEDHRKLRKRYMAPLTEQELTRLHQRIFQAPSKKSRMRAAKQLANRRMQQYLHCMKMRQRQSSAVFKKPTS